jgi:cardiolipin synthase
LESGLDLIADSARVLVKMGQGAICKRVAMRCRNTTPTLANDWPAPSESQCDPQDEHAAPAFLQFYLDGAEALGTLHELIDHASSRIDVLMFQWESDAVGAAIARWLMSKAGPTLPVRILVDGGGNLVFGTRAGPGREVCNQAICELAQHAHVEVVRTRNPFGRFDHRKLVLIDGRIAWTGGRNFTQRGFFDQHDLSFTVQGPLVTSLADEFDAFWHDQGGHCPGPPVVQPRQDQFDNAAANAWARLVQTRPRKHQIERAVYTAVDHARHYILIENFTFSDSRLVFKLAEARRRGVDVRVMLTLSAWPEVINHANRVTADRLLRAGVRVYVYPGMTHVKAATVDGCWAYLGTANFDPLSLRRNRELGLSILAGPVVTQLEERLFRADFCPEWEIKEPLRLSLADCFWELLSSVGL